MEVGVVARMAAAKSLYENNMTQLATHYKLQ